jgi:hypothetical protein
MVDFCCPGCLGTPAEFRRRFEAPILAGREPGAAPAVTELGEERSHELSSLVNQFILRRTNKLLSDHLPPKVRVCGAVCSPAALSHSHTKGRQERFLATSILLGTLLAAPSRRS